MRKHQLLAASDNQGYEATFAYSPGGSGRLDAAYVHADPPGFDLDPRDIEYDYTGSPDPEAPTALLHRITQIPYATYAYDPAGNVTERWQEQTGNTVYVHDGDAMRRATGVDGSSETYYYGQPGERVLAVRRTPGGIVDRVRFWFGETEIWFNPNGSLIKRQVHLAQGVPIARIENGTAFEWTHTSMLGSLLVALNEDGSDITAGFSYTPFGEILDAIGSSDDHLRRFNGKEHDQVSGLLYYGHRYYDPLSLTWMQADPLYRFAPDMAWDSPRRMGLYTFSLNNPLRFVDPDGLDGKGRVVVGTIEDAAKEPGWEAGNCGGSNPSTDDGYWCIGSVAKGGGRENRYMKGNPFPTNRSAMADESGFGSGANRNECIGCGGEGPGTMKPSDNSRPNALVPIFKVTLDNFKAIEGGSIILSVLTPAISAAKQGWTAATKALDNAVENAAGKGAAQAGQRNIDDLVKAAQKEFPKKAGKIEQHHITPKYLGGDPKGPTVPIDAAYHQKITNEFRKHVPYGSPKPSPAELDRIMREVYEKFPLPGGG